MTIDEASSIPGHECTELDVDFSWSFCDTCYSKIPCSIDHVWWDNPCLNTFWEVTIITSTSSLLRVQSAHGMGLPFGYQSGLVPVDNGVKQPYPYMHYVAPLPYEHQVCTLALSLTPSYVCCEVLGQLLGSVLEVDKYRIIQTIYGSNLLNSVFQYWLVSVCVLCNVPQIYKFFPIVQDFKFLSSPRQHWQRHWPSLDLKVSFVVVVCTVRYGFLFEEKDLLQWESLALGGFLCI